MSDVAIRVSGLGKQYKIGALRPRADTLRDALTGTVRGLVNRLTPNGAVHADNSIWALKDVSFEVKRGEVLGVIGRNGAGKSTLLKILSRITEPTTGEVDLHGRVGSLLEVGTGFHAELSGRENIYLNGAILGMKRAEIQRKFDEIVDFSGVEQFIDTPVKHYSSGMYMRLAFAVAAHMETEILLVDEVLAVGDAEFQKKCLGKMGEVASEGRTVVFVSHQSNAVATLCDRCLLLENGNLRAIGPAMDILGRYLGGGIGASEWVPHDPTEFDNRYFRPTRVVLVDHNQAVLLREIRADESFGVVIEGLTQVVDVALTIGFALYASTGELLFWSLQSDVDVESWPRITCGANKLICWIPPHFLNEGQYRLELILSLHYTTWLCQPGLNAPSITFEVRGGLSESPYWILKRPGVVAPVLPFQRLE